MNKDAQLPHKTPDELLQVIEALHQELKAKDKKLQEQQQQIIFLFEQLHLFRDYRFGQRSEQLKPQERLFDEAALPDNVDEIVDADETILAGTHEHLSKASRLDKGKKRGRKPLPAHLPREIVLHDLQDHEKTCACGGTLHSIGVDISEQLELIPAKFFVLQHHKMKYACKACESGIKSARLPIQPIPKSIATAGLLAHIAVAKYEDHLPLYRQEKILQRIGVDMARATLSLWMIRAADLLLPIVELMQDKIIAYDVSYADETPVQVLKEPNREAKQKSYMWVFAGGHAEQFNLVYQYDPSRSHRVPLAFLEGYRGYLHCDGYAAYDTLARTDATKPSIIQVGCWYHVRRKFIEASKVSKREGIATKVVQWIAQLAVIEKKLLQLTLKADAVKAYREKHALPVIQRIKAFLDERQGQVLRQSTLGKAVHYTLNQWPKLLTYLKDGRLEISNNRIERAIKPFATGRKNWLFANSVEGAKAAAIFYSIIETCKAHKISAYAYLRHALKELPSCDTLEKLEALLPYNVEPTKLTLSQ